MLFEVLITVLVIFVGWALVKFKNKRQQEKFIYNLQNHWDGWIELADAEYRSLIFGKILYSTKEYVVGVGAVKNEHLPSELVTDIEAQIEPVLIEENVQLCRFLIDFAGGQVILSECKDQQLKEKLQPYVADYSQIQLMLGFDPAGFILVDSKEAKTSFENAWNEAS